jgi:quercetin dioxygenase-like cupin family protein
MQHAKASQLSKVPVTCDAFGKTSVQWFLRPDETALCIFRRFEMGPKGFIPVHSHPEEEHLYLLTGPLEIPGENKDVEKIETDEFVFIAPDEPHGFRNPNDYIIAWLCVIPRLSKENKYFGQSN